MPVSIPGIDNLSPAVKYVIAFAIIFLLLALFALILRRLTGGRMTLSNERGRARQPRLGIVDVYDLDRQRQLILLRRDNVEHLLLVGGPNDVVVETNIVRVPGARLPLPAEGERPDPVADRAPEMPQPRLAEPASRPGDAALAGAFAAESQPAPAQTRPVQPVIAQPTRPRPEPRPAPTPTPAARPVPNGTVEPRPAPQPLQPQPQQPSDAMRSLEAAVQRVTNRSPSPSPAQPVTSPAPATPAPPPPPAPAPKPVAPEAPTPVRAPIPQPVFRPVPPAEEPPRPAPPRPAAPPLEPARPAPPPPAPPPVPATPEPTPIPAPAPADAGKGDPFSIEDIEAEFARLLGRPLDRKD